MQVPMARPVEKSRACLTAITPAIKIHMETANEITPPKNGMNENTLNTPGEFENPIVLNSSP